MRRCLSTCLLLLFFTGAASAQPPDLDRWVERALQTFAVPGIALAIVKDDRVVVAKGYGVRKLGDPAPVDGRTLFGIASNTKAFTATALGLLVEEGKIEWDAPVVRYLPAFAMWDPFVTRELTVRDLLVHRSGLGLGAGDLLWWPESTYNRKEVARRLRFIPPATSFRSAYAYDNVLYLVAGELIEAVSGQTWEDFVATRILAKVGMTGTNVRHSAAAAVLLDLLGDGRFGSERLEQLHQVGALPDLEQHFPHLVPAENIFAMHFLEAHRLVCLDVRFQLARLHRDGYVVEKEKSRYRFEFAHDYSSSTTTCPACTLSP